MLSRRLAAMSCERQPPCVRLARPEDARAVAELHAGSWRRNYRGAYSDEFLDGDALEDRLTVWGKRLADGDPRRVTLLAERGCLIGFANTLLDDHASWGALLENLHVAERRRRTGVGSLLLTRTAEAALERRPGAGLYVWVLEQNTAAQAFYEARGGRRVERAAVTAPGGVASRLSGAPFKLRYAWADAGLLLRAP